MLLLLQKLPVTDAKFYVLVVTWSTQDNVKLLKQLESRFERIINWYKKSFNRKTKPILRLLN